MCMCNTRVAGGVITLHIRGLFGAVGLGVPLEGPHTGESRSLTGDLEVDLMIEAKLIGEAKLKGE